MWIVKGQSSNSGGHASHPTIRGASRWKVPFLTSTPNHAHVVRISGLALVCTVTTPLEVSGAVNIKMWDSYNRGGGP